jgi:hypothetical protein
MADVLVRRCTVRVVRHGGWSWGRDPRALLDRVVRRVPELIAAELDQLFPADEEREIAAPVRLVIPLPLAMLQAFAGEAEATARAPSADVRDGVAVRVTQALHQALGAEAASAPSSPPATTGADGAETLATTRAERAAIAPANPISVLVAWLRSGQLPEHLSGFSVAALRAWHDWIVSAPAAMPAAPTEQQTINASEEIAHRLREQWPGTGSDELAVLRRRLAVFAAVEMNERGALQNPAVRNALDRIVPAPAARAIERRTDPAAPTAKPPPPATDRLQREPMLDARVLPRPTGPVTGPVRTPSTWEMPIESALPFLLIGPLARTGYLDTLAAVFAAARISDALPLFAMALAYKVLAPPKRGWLREPSTRAAAAAFGLLPEAPPDSALSALAISVAEQLSPLNAVVTSTLVAGHRLGTPLLVTAAVGASDGRLLLSDVDGLFPLAIASQPDELTALLGPLLHETVLVAAAAASPDLMSALDRAQVRFVTDAPPGRDESWRNVRGRPGEVWWSNDHLAPAERLAAAGRQLPSASAAADEFWQAVVLDRPAVPRASNEACEAALTLAAGLALGSIGWELRREREAPSPQAALARFADLDARIRVDPAKVCVLLPLGQRFFDLRAGGFLNDVHDVPWFGGRVLQLTSG